MRKLMISLALVAVSATTASYGFGLPKIPGVPAVLGGGGSGISGDSVEQFITIGQQSTAEIEKARLSLAAALSTKEERAKLLQQQAQIKTGLDAKDQKAKDDNKAFQASLDAQLKAALDGDSAKEKLSAMSTDQLEMVGKSILLMAHGVMLQKEQIPAGQNMVTAISSNPMLVTKLPAIKDTIANMMGNVATAGGYLVKFPTLMKSANVNITLPTDSSSKPDGNVDPSVFD